VNPIEILAAKAALKKMIGDGYVNICVIDSILKVTGGIPRSEDYRVLHLLHCVKFTDMPNELVTKIPDMIKRVVESPALDFVIDLDGGIPKANVKFLK